MSSRLALGSCSSAVCDRRLLLLALLVLGVLTVPAAADEPAARPPLTAAQQQRLKERDRYSEKSTRLQNAGKFSEAVAAAVKMLAIEREVLGNDDWDVATSLERLAQIQELQPDLAAARKSCEEAVAIATRRDFKSAWQMTDARLALERVALLEKSSPQQRQQLADADRLGIQIDALIGQRRYRQAIPLALRGMELRKAALGPSHELLGLSYHAISFSVQFLRPICRGGTLGAQGRGDRPASPRHGPSRLRNQPQQSGL